MRNLVKAAIALSFISAAAIGTTATVQAQGVYFDAPGVHVGVGGYPYHHRRYYNYYGGGLRTWNSCPPDWLVQGGVCKPYRPWDVYGGQQGDYGW